MANVTTPATFEYTGGGIRSTRINGARFRYSPSTTLVSSKDTPTTTAAEIPQLDVLQRQTSYFDAQGRPTVQMQLHYQRMVEAIVSAFEAVNQRVDEVAILARLSAVEAKAEVANDNAVEARAIADTVKTATQQTFDTVSPGSGDTFNDTLVALDPDRFEP